MSKATKHIGRGARAWTAALAMGLLGLALFASAAQAVPTTFWGVVPQATPSAEQFQRLRGGGVDSVRIPIDWGGVQPVRGGALNWSGIDSVVAKAATAGVEVLPFLNGAPAWAVPSVWVPGSGHTVKAPSHLPGRRRCRDRLVELRQRRGRPLRAQRQLLGREPDGSQAPDPHLADLERGELQVLRRQAQPGRIRPPGEAVLRGPERLRRRGQAVARWHVLATQGRQIDQGKAEAGLLRLRFPRTDVRNDAGDQVEVQRRRPASLHRPLPGTAGRDRRSPPGPEGQRRRRQGSLDHRARLVLAAAPGEPPAEHLRQGPRRPGLPAERRLLTALAASRRSGSCSASTGSRSTTRPAPATSATAPACSPRASCPRSPGSPTSSSPAAPRSGCGALPEIPRAPGGGGRCASRRPQSSE